MQKKKILVVDDDATILGFLECLFGRKYEVILGANAMEARDALARHPDLDAFLCDYNLGSTSGLELLNEARRLYPDMPRLIMSSELDARTMADAVNNGIVHRIIQKPWSNIEIMELMHVVTHAKREPRAAKRNPGLNGTLNGIPLGDVLCMLTARRKSGQLVIGVTERPEARICLEYGRIIDVVVGGHTAPGKLEELLERDSGFFAFEESAAFAKISDHIPVQDQIIMI